MKKNYFILIVIFCVSFLMSCEKEEAIMSSTSSTVRVISIEGVSDAKITAYKYKNGKFKKYRTQLGVKNGSQFFCKDCLEVIFSQQKPFTRKKTKSLSQYIANWSGLSGNRAKKNESVCGLFEYYDQEFARTLTW